MPPGAMKSHSCWCQLMETRAQVIHAAFHARHIETKVSIERTFTRANLKQFAAVVKRQAHSDVRRRHR